MDKLTIIELNYERNSVSYFDIFSHLSAAIFLDSRNMTTINNNYDIIVALPTLLFEMNDYNQFSIHNYITNKTSYLPANNLLSEMQAESQKMALTAINDITIPFSGGFVGYWAYEFGAFVEKKLPHQKTAVNSYLMRQGLYHWAIIFDHGKHEAKLVIHPDIDIKIKSRLLKILKNNNIISKKNFILHSPFNTVINFQQYNQAFDKIKNYIKQGDCYQVNLSQQFVADCCGNSWQAYKYLRSICPSGYSAYLHYDDEQIISNSPEQFINFSQGVVTTSPIKGTIARSTDKKIDQQNQIQLQNSTKDRAENLMIVDLMRNDLGKLCIPGSIKVPELFKIDSLVNVHHLVSKVIGKLQKDYDAFDLIQACFPGGSVTGAPKIRSMEIIAELEVAERNIFCGSISYIGYNGIMNSNICIRTLAVRSNKVYCWAGGAIVADSDCVSEYEESLVKVMHLLKTLEKKFLIS